MRAFRIAAFTLLLLPRLGSAQMYETTEALKRLSVEDLLNVEVTSVSRTEESLRSAAAAVTILSADTIHRSGVTSLAETLRSVPGIHVGRQTSNVWAVSARGFSNV